MGTIMIILLLIVDSLETLVNKKTELTNQIRNLSKDAKEERAELISKSQFISKQIKEMTKKKEKRTTSDISTNVMSKVEKLCANCNEKYESSNKKSKSRSPQVVFCPKCRKIRNNDILEIISADTNITIFSDHEKEEAESFLKELNAHIRLDLHKTLDTISPSTDVKIGIKSSCAIEICCLSYVGSLTETRIGAREDIVKRIKAGQISFGALVFKRGSHKDQELSHKFISVGSKAWFNNLTGYVECSKNAGNCYCKSFPLFVDDSSDHVESTRYVGVRSLLISPNDKLVELIRNNL